MTELVYQSGYAATGIKPAPPAWAGLPRLKYVGLRAALALLPVDVCKVIKAAPIAGVHRWALVDVKADAFGAGDWPCIPGWHVDGNPDPASIELPEVHHLIVFGDVSLTEFLGGPISIYTDGSPSSTAKAIRQAHGPVVAIPDGEFVSYGPQGIHRCARARSAGNRLLIRVTETNHVRPRSARPHPPRRAATQGESHEHY